MRVALLPLSLVLFLNFNITTLFSALQISAGQRSQQGPTKSANEAWFLAASGGDINIVSGLIVAGVDVNVKDNFGQTGLMLSAEKGHLAVVKALLAAGADPNSKDHNERTALIVASAFGRADVVGVLLDAGAKPSESNSGALRIAAEEGYTDLVKTLLAAGADANARGFTGTTALMYAAAGGHIEMVKALLAAGADANAKNNDGMDAFTAATAKGYGQITELLKSAGADITSERFAREVQELARQFASRLQQTRDFDPLIEELFVERFMDCQLETMREGKVDGIFSQIGSVSVPLEIASQVAGDELKRYLVTVLNFFHLKTLHRLSSLNLPGDGDKKAFNPDQEYPPGVYELLMKYPMATQSSKTVQQLRNKVQTLEEASSIMRDHLIAHPPEETQTYRENMERIGNKKYSSKFAEIGLFKLPDTNARAISQCLGLPVRQFVVVKIPPFYQVFIVQVKKGFKIGMLMCTEPPCVD